MTSQTNLGNTFKKPCYFNSTEDIPKDFTGSFYMDNGFYYYKDRKLHREDGPAVEFPDGYKAWYLNNKRHRQHGPAIEYKNGTKEWWLNGKVHRENGPAIERVGGSKYWYLNGERHRLDGPAIENADGTKGWYYHNKEYGTNNDFTNESWKHFQRTLLF